MLTKSQTTNFFSKKFNLFFLRRDIILKDIEENISDDTLLPEKPNNVFQNATKTLNDYININEKFLIKFIK